MANPPVSSLWLFILLGLINFAKSQVDGLDNRTTPVSFFYSRPDLQPPAINVSLHNESLVESGYIFISPYQEIQAGPYIFDKFGNLVWSGYAKIGSFNAHNPHICQYGGKPHLCMFQGNQHHGYARGHAIVLDSDYDIVAQVQSAGELAPLDQHEFKILDDGESAVISIYQQATYDLSRVGVTQSQGWIMDSIFQEINMTDGSLLFEWSALGHVDPFASYVPPSTSDVSGDGRGPQTGWDFFHINSVSKSSLTGNYIISARHMSTIYNINGTDGSIIWRLEAGGNSDFNCIDFNFGFQHDAQIQEENSTSITISLYDNASNNFNDTAPVSAGKFISIDYQSMEARLSSPSIVYPDFELRSASQGNLQVLPNGNRFQGYGSWPIMSEHTPDGKAVWAANFGPDQGVTMSYRSTSGPWYSIPSKTRPAIWTYSRSSDSPLVLYVSWNGCTETASWNLYGGNDVHEAFTKIGNVKKGGFETQYTSDTHFAYAIAEAVDGDGKGLRNSSMQQTFVPSALLGEACNDNDCPIYEPPPPPPPPADPPPPDDLPPPTPPPPRRAVAQR